MDFVTLLEEVVELDEGRGRPKKAGAADIEAQFKAAKKDEKALNKLIMKYGDHDEDDIKKFKTELKTISGKAKKTKGDEKKEEDLNNKINVYNIVKKYTKYQTKFSAEDFGRNGDVEHSVVK